MLHFIRKYKTYMKFKLKSFPTQMQSQTREWKFSTISKLTEYMYTYAETVSIARANDQFAGKQQLF